jgi:histidine triad (HIT) family protein
MYNHEPQNYSCPFCRIINHAKVHGLQSSEVIYSSELVTAFLALGRRPNNPINVLVVSNGHFENIFDLPFEYVLDIH